MYQNHFVQQIYGSILPKFRLQYLKVIPSQPEPILYRYLAFIKEFLQGSMLPYASSERYLLYFPFSEKIHIYFGYSEPDSRYLGTLIKVGTVCR